MNCKPGDLCVIVRSMAGNEGVLCKVLDPMGCEPLFEGYIWGEGAGPCWLVELGRQVKTIVAGQLVSRCPIPDAWLRPILPPPGTVTTDEVRELYSPKQTEAA